MCERNTNQIPWSQQVDEASYENLASPTSHDDNPGAHQNSMQFQYPPFNAKENQNIAWNNSKPRKSNNYESNNKKYNKTTFHNNSKREDTQPNAWGPPNARRNFTDGPSANYNRSNRSDDNFSVPGKLDNRPSNNISTDDKRVNVPTVAPKKTTWASIASQPAKSTLRTTLATSSQKKKGPGMPPPPMVPGKHDLDVNSWDLPNNNPPPVPSPPPPVDSAPNLNADFSVGYMATTESESARNFDRGQPSGGSNYDLSRDDGKPIYNNGSYGRARHSPNGHPRKNWSTQHPLHQNRQTNTAPSGPSRRNDSGSNAGFGPNRYSNDRRGHYSNSRSEYDGDVRDENCPRNVERASSSDEVQIESPQAVLDELRDKNNYNPVELELETAANARFFVIKSYSEDDIHRSIKYEIWCSTPQGNKRLDEAFKERQKEGGNILLFFSVNGSGHFCGMAQMMTSVDYNSTSSVWSQDKWKGKFKVKWVYVKDVPNGKLRHIRLENNDNKSVTNSRDTQEVPNAQGIEVLQILHSFQHVSSIFDDFFHYEERQKEEVSSKKPVSYEPNTVQSPTGRQFNTRQNDDRYPRDRDGRSGGVGGAQKYFPNSGASFRDRNSRNNYHSNSGGSGNFHRNSDYQHPQRERDSSNTEREIGDHGTRYISKFDYNRRDDRALPKSNNREQRSADFSDSEHNSKGEMRFRSGLREPQKDNEHIITERPRGAPTSAADY